MSTQIPEQSNEQQPTAQVFTPRRLIENHVPGKPVINTVLAMDPPGAGGASTRYEILRPDGSVFCSIAFQNGPNNSPELINGIHQEDLIAIVIDRLKGLQQPDAPFRGRENAAALTHFEEGLMWLKARSLERIARGVEGTHQK